MQVRVVRLRPKPARNAAAREGRRAMPLTKPEDTARWRRILFDEFEMDVRQRVLLRGGVMLPLPSKVFSLLLTLVRNAGTELSKTFLIQAVWPDCIVDASNLTQSIFLLRRALGQTADGRRLIVTIPGQGYLFAGDVRLEPEAEDARPERSAPAEARDPSLRSIAVLPLHVLDMDSTSHTQYLGEGIADALLHRLSYIQQIDVRSTGALLRYANPAQVPQDIGRELGVSLLVTGSVFIEHGLTAADSLLRVTLQLMNVQDRSLLWSDSAEYNFSRILALQDALAEKLGAAIAAKLTAQEQKQLTRRYTHDDDAYQDYLRGRYYSGQWTIRGWLKAIECFSKAVQRDPGYALAYCGIADAEYMASNLYSPPLERMAKAKIAATRALELDDSLAEAHTSIALVQGFFDWNWARSEASFRRAIELNPRSSAAYLWYGRLLATMGRFDESIDTLRRSQKLDPLSAAVNAEVGRALYYARRFDEGIEQLRETLELDPNFWPAHLFLGWIYEQQGYFTEAIAILGHSSELDDNPRTRASLGVAYAFAGKETEAEKILISLREESEKRYVSDYYIAAIYVALGDNTRALRYFEKAYADRSEGLVWLRVDPRFDSIRADKRFDAFIRKVGIPSTAESRVSLMTDKKLLG